MTVDITDAEVAQLGAEIKRGALPDCYVVEKDGEYFVNWSVPDARLKRQPATRLETRRVTTEQAHRLVAAGADWKGPLSARP